MIGSILGFDRTMSIRRHIIYLSAITPAGSAVIARSFARYASSRTPPSPMTSNSTATATATVSRVQTSTRPPLVYKPIPRTPSSQAVPPDQPAAATAVEQPPPRRPDPEAGLEAAKTYVREGRLPERYRGAAWRVTAIIVAMPIVLVTSWMLWQRLFQGKEQKRLVHTRDAQSDEDDTTRIRVFGERES